MLKKVVSLEMSILLLLEFGTGSKIDQTPQKSSGAFLQLECF